MRILLVEDEPLAARMLAKGLRERAYAVDLATDGGAALEQVATNDYDAIVLDVMLPVRNGFAVCRAIRRVGVHAPGSTGPRGTGACSASTWLGRHGEVGYLSDV